MSKEPKAAVVGGWMDDQGAEVAIMLIGTYKNVQKAYGAAYTFLVEEAESYKGYNPPYKGTEFTVSLPEDLEADTGYAMYLQNKDGKNAAYAYILFKDEEES